MIPVVAWKENYRAKRLILRRDTIVARSEKSVAILRYGVPVPQFVSYANESLSVIR